MSQKEPASKEPLLKRTVKFIHEVRKEVSQVVWPTRRDAGITTIIVCIFASLMSLYLLLVDQSVLYLVQAIMN
ncbi:MAG: preprotein translocase subunit SecE [Holosporales bacterium]|jgi:preprotein translocase subunit SecE|nr:preprotein translocase subunit SecE [Holosporales bacterium]